MARSVPNRIDKNNGAWTLFWFCRLAFNNSPTLRSQTLPGPPFRGWYPQTFDELYMRHYVRYCSDYGELDCWIDGRKSGEFRNINWRSTDSLKINQVQLSLYLEPESYDRSGGGMSRTVWYDDVVVATQYIGLKVQRAATRGATAPVPAGR